MEAAAKQDAGSDEEPEFEEFGEEERGPVKRKRDSDSIQDESVSEDEWAAFEEDDSDSEDEVLIEDAVVIDPALLQGYHARKKLSREERIAAAMSTGNTYGKTKGGGMTNAEKKRRKNFGMIKHSASVRAKLKQSLKEQHRLIKKRVEFLSKQGTKKVKRGRR